MLNIRRAVYEDIPNIMQFMDEHWKPGNILAKNREFFEWQFVDGDKLNMFIGIDDTSGKIYGMIGAIVYNRNQNPDISGCTWQVIKSGNPILGIELSEYMEKQLQPRYLCSLGLTEKAAKINRLLGCTITSMDHYYRLADREDYQVAKVVNKIIPAVEDTGYRLQQIFSVEDMKQIIPEEKLMSFLLSKDYAYIEKRYFEHPIYQYDKWKIIDEEGRSSSVMVTRDEMVQDRKICKIVDYYGNFEDLAMVTMALDKVMMKRNYEFVDIYSYGVPTTLYERGGFSCCDDNCENIIPNYFHPFVKRNITLKMIDPMIPGITMFRGDADQDRPC